MGVANESRFAVAPFASLSHLAVACVYTGKVDFADEGDVGRRVGVLGTAVDFERVDAVLVNAL